MLKRLRSVGFKVYRLLIPLRSGPASELLFALVAIALNFAYRTATSPLPSLHSRPTATLVRCGTAPALLAAYLDRSALRQKLMQRVALPLISFALILTKKRNPDREAVAARLFAISCALSTAPLRKIWPKKVFAHEERTYAESGQILLHCLFAPSKALWY